MELPWLNFGHGGQNNKTLMSTCAQERWIAWDMLKRIIKVSHLTLSVEVGQMERLYIIGPVNKDHLKLLKIWYIYLILADSI